MIRGPRPGRLRMLTAATLLTLVGTTVPSALLAPSGAAAPEPGAPGVGDPYFPLDGNGSIDVQHYRIKVAYDFEAARLRGSTTLTLVPTAELSRFNLDLLLPASKVTVDGVEAGHRRSGGGHELVVRPKQALAAGVPVEVEVRYAGHPGRKRYAGESNWLADRHEVVTMNQPHMAPWWFPANDHPSDKATYDVSVTVPRGHQVISNGTRVGSRTKNDTRTVRWASERPMASYLAFFAAGRFQVESGTSEGLPWTAAVSRRLMPHEQRASMRMLRRSPRIVRALEQDLGAYPFSNTGGLVTSLDVDFALENQTRPTYPVLGRSDTWLLVHELAHQWFGDSVAVSRWRDIWLNEGAASFMEQRFLERQGGSAQQWLTELHGSLGAGQQFWKLQIADPGRRNIFDSAIYTRGAMAFQALRTRIGEDAFWTLLRTWLGSRADGNGTSEEFEALASQVSGQDLTAFFQAWLREPTRPAATPENGLR
ncbi:M1 family metallopeptidase [Nocardioides campestrisoli]|uniref:M1 family metallopeptidase n=1 Tax=Nocardioides campestrisoli TaxID=2736757 RepID=UPI0015E63D80|nr:M1 family metallopeptidase [Nocardioides campestrisoli]